MIACCGLLRYAVVSAAQDGCISPLMLCLGPALFQLPLQITTRYFHAPGGAAMIPVLDLLNHMNGCQTFAVTEPCSGTGSGQQAQGSTAEYCCVIRTRTAVPKGHEVCNTYGWLAPDHIAFQYGFISPEGLAEAAGRAPALSRIDRQGFGRANMTSTDLAPPEPFTGGIAGHSSQGFVVPQAPHTYVHDSHSCSKGVLEQP